MRAEDLALWLLSFLLALLTLWRRQVVLQSAMQNLPARVLYTGLRKGAAARWLHFGASR